MCLLSHRLPFAFVGMGSHQAAKQQWSTQCVFLDSAYSATRIMLTHTNLNAKEAAVAIILSFQKHNRKVEPNSTVMR